MKPLPSGRLTVEVVEDPCGFLALEEEWEDLYSNSPRATPFQSWGWLYSWWEYYGAGYALRLIVMRDGAGLLVGLVPLMLEYPLGRPGSFVPGRLLFVGTGVTDYLDLLAREGSEDFVFETGVQTLRRMGSWGVVDLQELRPEAAAWGLFGSWGGPKAYVWKSTCLEIRVQPWEDLLTSLSKDARKIARRTLRRVDEDNVHPELASPQDAAEAAKRLIALHQEQWRGRDVNPEHLSERFARHLMAAAPRMTRRGSAGVQEFLKDGDAIASDFLVFGRDFVGAYLAGACESTRRRLQTEALYNHKRLNVALERGVERVSLLRGQEPYKRRWNPEAFATHRAILGRDHVSFAFYAGYHALRSRAAVYAKSDHTPGWAKAAIDRLKGRLPA